MARVSPTLDEIKTWPATCPAWPDAGSALGYGRNGTYDAIRTGAFPVRVLRIGNRLRVSTAELIDLLEGRSPQGGDKAA